MVASARSLTSVGTQGDHNSHLTSAEQLAHLIDVMPAAVVVVDGDGRVSRANTTACAWMGERLVGQLWRELVATRLAPHGGDVTLQDGRVLNLSTCPLGGEPGQVVVMQDVTENRRLHQRLGQYRRLSAMGEMAARLAHQIRTPLAAVMLHLSNLAGRGGDDVQRVAGKCLERLHHLNRVVEDMLLFARGGTQRTENIVVGELLQQLRQQNPAATGRSVIAVADHSEGLCIRGNRTLLISMLQNLIDNAVQALGGGGEITIAARPLPERRVEVAVTDDGPGVPAEIRERIFEPFFTTRAQGTGLGLAVVHAIARDHKAAIEVDCNTDKEGAVFRIVFPTLERAGAARPDQATAQSGVGHGAMGAVCAANREPT